MKTIDLIGMFSRSDLIRNDNPVPVLFKFIASILNDDYQINRIFLIYGAGTNNKEETFRENWALILEQLKTYFPDKSSRIEKIRDRVEIQYPDFKEVSVSIYYSLFSDILKKSKSDVVYFNLQSGNIQSKEALLVLYETFAIGKEVIYYSESIENKSSTSHTIDVDAAELYKYVNELSDNEQKLDDVIKRVGIKDTNELSLIFHKNIILKFLEGKQYFKAYYHYINHKTLFENNSATSVLNNCFSDEIEELFITDSLLKKTVAKYLLFRLIYLKAREEAGVLDTKISYRVCDKLLWVYRNLENTNIIRDDGDSFINLYAYDFCLERNLTNNLDNHSKFDSIESIDDSLIQSFNMKYNTLRHARDYRYAKVDFSNKDFALLLSQLIKKFELKFNDYLPVELKGTDFSGCFEKTMQRCKSNINTQLKDKICFNLKSDKICILSMFGSTDPAKSNSDGLYPGSNLSFFKSISEEANLPDDKKELKDLRDKKKHCKIPYYCILSNEIINLLFGNELNYDVDTLKEIYQFDDIYFLPFERMKDGLIPDIRKIIKDEKIRFSIDDLKSGKSLKDDEDGYDYKVCGEYIADTIHGLLDKYDIIYLVETSGIPNCKMALAFLSLCYPERIRVVEVKSPFWNQKKDSKPEKLNQPIQVKQVLLKKSDSLLDIIEKDDFKKTIGTLYLLQNAIKDDFEKNGLHLKTDILVKMNVLDNNVYQDEAGEVARRLVRVYYQLQYHMHYNALLELDYCFETVLGKTLKLNKVGCYDKLNLIEPSNAVYELYRKCIDKTYDKSKGDDEYNIVKSFIRMINYILENIREPAIQRKYYSSALRLYKIWEIASHLKHPVDLKRVLQEAEELKMTSKDIDCLLMFDISNGKKIENKYKELKEEYESIRKDLDIRFDD